MRLLFFLEPVVFGCRPALLENHLMWAECIERAAVGSGGSFALVCNAEVAEAWRRRREAGATPCDCHTIDSYAVLQAFGCRRASYAQALFGDGLPGNALSEALEMVADRVSPDLVVMTSQNAFARRAFAGVRCLHIEQAPLPRLGHPLRTAFDPCGHQVGSLLETHAPAIRDRPLDASEHAALRSLLADVVDRMFAADPRAAPACEALQQLAQGAPVALLATQPGDWVTAYGADQEHEFENLLYDWSLRLPPGWIGVPTYHPGHRLEGEMERSLARASPRLKFLPSGLAQGLTEALLPLADGLVTVSSTTAMTALLLRKRVVVTGRSPYTGWCPAVPEQLADAMPLSSAQAHATLAFLTSRYSHVHAALTEEPSVLVELMDAAIRHPDPPAWFTDLAAWSIGRARSLFNLPSSSRRMAVQRSLH